MSSFFMISIAAMYWGAAVSYALEGRLKWACIAACWGIGNALLAGMK